MGNATLGPGGRPDNSLRWIAAEPGVFAGVVINIGWSELQPTPGTFDTTAIDQALADVVRYNAIYKTTPLGVRLNVQAALLAPGWVKNLGGPPIVTLYQLNPPAYFTIGRFWSPEYRAAWTALQNRLAARYDANPLIREVTNGACASVTDEPIVLITSAFALKNMHDAGFSDAEYEQCLANSPADYAAWRQTAIHMPFNPFPRTDTGFQINDIATTESLIRAWRAALGPRAILANHNLRAGPNAPEYPGIVRFYQLFRRLGPPIDLQSDEAIEDWPATIETGIEAGATEIEFWPGMEPGRIQHSVTRPQWAAWAAQLRENQK